MRAAFIFLAVMPFMPIIENFFEIFEKLNIGYRMELFFLL